MCCISFHFGAPVASFICMSRCERIQMLLSHSLIHIYTSADTLHTALGFQWYPFTFGPIPFNLFNFSLAAINFTTWCNVLLVPVSIFSPINRRWIIALVNEELVSTWFLWFSTRDRCSYVQCKSIVNVGFFYACKDPKITGLCGITKM